MESTRQKKVARLILKELSQIFNKESNNILGPIMISVTAVRISPDLAYANVYLSIFPVKDLLDALNKIKKKSSLVRKKLGVIVRNQLRIVPELNFFIDDSADYAEEIDLLLKK
jgi:ribosome-binding factor A|tara:strand:- start:8397 stop:8735 length:339 start_codon:yes stop_codon:yes gene_type:complete